ncbi:MAG: PQQ-binding-like beta-propeller repeat protein [Anaerolineales bacterium]|nr:PQQ-binding-like beta-propeller repeat protein [Anaerolineales bacterium]
MSENRPASLTCPTCGAALDYDGRSSLLRCRYCRNVCIVPGAVPDPAAAPGLVLDEIRILAAGGKTLEAVKRYREIHAVGLKEALQAVEALQAGRLAEPSELARAPLAVEDSREVVEEIQELLRTGNKMEAIRHYREIYDVSMARASYAVERIEAGQTIWPEAGFPTPPAPSAAPTAAPTPGKAGSRLTWILPVFFLLLVGGILAFAFSRPGSPFVPFLFANGPAVLLPPGPDSPPDVAAVFYDVNDEVRLVGRIDAASGRLLWRSEPLPGSGYVQGIARDEALVFVASERDLLALSQVDGSLAWQVRMPDNLNYSDSNLLVTDGRVVTSNVDQTLQAYDAATGTLLWSRRLTRYDRSLRLVGGDLLVIDTIGDETTFSLIFIDPVDGRELRQITPTCQQDERSVATIDPGAGLLYDQAENALYLVFDSSPGCVQRLDLATGQTTWQVLADDWFTFSASGFTGLLADDLLYFNQGGQLYAVERDSGKMHLLLTDEDYDLVPLAVSGDTLLVRARRTRGSQRFELWALERVSGERLWQMPLEGSSPLDPPDEMSGLVDDDTSAWTWHLAPEGLQLIHFEAEPSQIVITSIDLADGTLRSETTVALRSVYDDFYSAPEIIGWQESLLYAIIDGNIYAILVDSGKIVFER